MKLLILTDGIHPFVIGGMQKHSYYLAKNLALQGNKVTLVHCVDAAKKLPSMDEITTVFGDAAVQNIEFITLRFPAASWYPGHYLKESYIFRNSHMKSYRSDLPNLISYMRRDLLLGIFWRKKRRVQRSRRSA